MRKLLALLTIAIVVFAVVYRQRIFLRDPLASVTRDGIKVDGAAVMINYSNDVLLQDASAGRKRLYLVQNWNRVAEAPTAPVNCIQWVACMTDADRATAAAIPVGRRGRRQAFDGVTMTNRRVEFVDENGDLVQATIR